MAMIRMKKLVSSGVAGAAEGYVPRGREFTAATEQRAKELEENGLAYRVATRIPPEPPNKTELPPPSNKAAEAGPFVSVGGTTGADVPVPLSPPDPPLRRRRSARSKEEGLL